LLQNYSRTYHKLAVWRVPPKPKQGEFWKIYKLDVVSIPY
jgi:preprotein translocase subunit SecA